MKILFSLFATLALSLSSLQAVVPPAAMVESNMTFALKMYINNVDEDFGETFITQTYATVTLKNADIIRAYAEFNEVQIGKAARLIKQDWYDAEGDLILTRIVIREKGAADIDITDAFTFDTFGYPDSAEKYKYSTSTGKGTRSAIERNSIDYLVGTDEDEFVDEYMNLICMDRVTQRRVLFADILVDLESRSSKVTGDGQFYVIIKGVDGYLEGLMEGTYKVSGAKAITVEP